MSYKEERWENYPLTSPGPDFNTTNAASFGTAGMTNIQANSGTMNVINTDAAAGAQCLQCDWPTTIAGQFAIPDTAAADAVCAFDYKLLAFPAVTDSQFPIGARHASGQIGRIETSLTGQFRSSMTSVSAYGTALTLNVWRRVEVQLIGAGTASTALNYFVYTDTTGMTLYDSGSVTGVNTTALGQIVQWRWGRLSGQTGAISYRVDNCRSDIGTSTLLGPLAVPAGVTQIGYRSLWSPAAASQASLR